MISDITKVDNIVFVDLAHVQKDFIILLTLTILHLYN